MPLHAWAPHLQLPLAYPGSSIPLLTRLFQLCCNFLLLRHCVAGIVLINGPLLCSQAILRDSYGPAKQHNDYGDGKATSAAGARQLRTKSQAVSQATRLHNQERCA